MKHVPISMVIGIIVSIILFMTGCSNVSRQEYEDLLEWCKDNNIYNESWVPVGRVRTSSSIYTGWSTYYYGFQDVKDQSYYSLEVGKGKEGHFYVRLWGNCILEERDVNYQLSGVEHIEEVSNGEAFSDIYELHYIRSSFFMNGRFEIYDEYTW